MEGYSGGGYPVSGQAEAYWNFGWPGVVLVYLAFGAATRFIADWRTHARNNPIAAIVLVAAAFTFNSPSTVTMVSFLQTVVLIAVTVFVTRMQRRPA